jgi:hypothetical protein
MKGTLSVVRVGGGVWLNTAESGPAGRATPNKDYHLLAASQACSINQMIRTKHVPGCVSLALEVFNVSLAASLKT